MKTDGMRILGWGVPIACMAIAVYAIVSQNAAFTDASKRRDAANRHVEEMAREKKTLDQTKPEKKYATEIEAPQEDINFLDYLRTRATLHGVTLEKESSFSSEYGKEKGAAALDPKIATLLRGIRRISISLTLSGPYYGLLELIKELERSDRLFTLSGVSWNRAEAGNTLALTVSRYVAPSTPPPDPSATVVPLNPP